MTIKNVTIGDRFINPKDRKSQRVSIVTDFVEKKSMKTGKVFDYECVCQKDFLGNILTSTVPFSTVVRNKVAN